MPSAAEIYVENTAYHFDLAYTYLLPDDILSGVLPGCRVMVPFGGGNKGRQGLITRIFTEKNEDGMTYQDAFNDNYSAKEAEEVLLKWLKEFGYHHDERDAIQEFAKSDEIGHIIEKNNQIVVEDIHAKGIPTMIYDNKKHSGKYEE